MLSLICDDQLNYFLLQFVMTLQTLYSYPTAKSILSRTSCQYELVRETQIVETENKITDPPKSFVLHRKQNQERKRFD
jgi:hypothetical protein